MSSCHLITSRVFPFHYQWAELNSCNWGIKMLKFCENSVPFTFQKLFILSLSCILKSFFFFSFFHFSCQFLHYSHSQPPCLLGKTPTTESAFDYFTCNQHSFIKKQFISFSVAQSTDYCGNCKTFRVFSLHSVDRPLDL